jgi:hypothetical protein
LDTDEEQVEDEAGAMRLASSIEGLLTGQANVNLSEALEMFDPPCNPALNNAVPSCLILEPMEFIDYFSKIIIIESAATPTNQVSGGSRDEWSRFQHRCPNHIFGCPYTSGAVSYISNHAIICKYISIEAGEELDHKKLTKEAQEKVHKCPTEGCGKSFDNPRSLRQHKKRCNWVPKGCTAEGCDPTIIFKTKGAMDKHRENKHCSFTPRSCPLAAICQSTLEYENKDSYRSHLIRTHKLVGQELAEHMH